MEQIVYVASSKSQQIHVWKLNAEGSLTLVQLVDVSGQVRTMVISPDKYFLYVGVRPRFRIITYGITFNNGTLNLIKEFPLLSGPTHISVEHKGNFLFSSSYNTDCISIIHLERGIPTKTIDIVKGLEGCHSANISPDNRTLWIPALKQDRIYLFNLNKDGKLISRTPEKLETIKGAGPRHMVFHPNNQYAYVINELNSSVDVWRISNIFNDIKCVQTLDIMPTNFIGTRWAADIHITPDGHHLYTCDRTSSTLTIFSVSKDGSRLLIEGFQPTEVQPRSFSVDSFGKFLIVAGQKSHRIVLYKIKDEHGLLEEKGRYAVGQEPVWVTVNTYLS